MSAGRFTPEEAETFNILKEILFDEEITKFTTIVRTNFPKFRKKEECSKDLQILIEESKTIKEIIESCNGIIYVDNPSLEVDEEEVKEAYLKRRDDSRINLLNHLNSFKCQGCYKPYPKTWDRVHLKVGSYIKKKRSLEVSLSSSNNEQMKKEIKNMENKNMKKINPER